MSIEAMKMALEALEQVVYLTNHDDEINDAIDALSAAIDQAGQRQWVGLAVEELQAIDDSFRLQNTVGLTDYYRAIETKLKEKNA
jgi:hypothetical protein